MAAPAVISAITSVVLFHSIVPSASGASVGMRKAAAATRSMTGEDSGTTASDQLTHGVGGDRSGDLACGRRAASERFREMQRLLEADFRRHRRFVWIDD